MPGGGGGGGGHGDRGGGANRGRGGHGHSQSSDNGSGGSRHRGNDGLNPNRQKGFNWQTRIVTPTLNDMKAKQGAVVSKFMNFMSRKNSVMVELYERAFYNKKPGWDNLANFVYNDLCPNDQLRNSVEDVQFHPVKMILFIKFKTEEVRDQMVDRLQTGVFWTDYGVSVRGHSLDADVKLIRVLGVSPETTAEDIKNTFAEVGVGEVVDLRKGLLDPRRLPEVTNGTWMVRVRIMDADKNIPPYIIRREEGELWSLNFEGRRFVCWKCGSSDHIGDKCKDQERTFEEVFGDDMEAVDNSWAAVVKGKSGLDGDARAKRDAIAKQIKDSNDVKARERKQAEERRVADLEDIESRRVFEESERKKALEKGKNNAQELSEELDVLGDSFEEEFTNATKEKNTIAMDISGGNEDIGNNSNGERDGVGFGLAGGLGVPLLVPRVNVERGEDDPGGNQSEDQTVGSEEEPAGVQQRLVIDRIDPVLLGVKTIDPVASLIRRSFKLDNSLEEIFGHGATRLAIEFEGMSNVESVHNMSDSSNDDDSNEVPTSNPGREGSKKRLRGENGNYFGDLSSVEGGHSSGEDSVEGLEGESKKLKVGGSNGELSDEEEVTDRGLEEQQQSGELVQMQVTPGDAPGFDQEHVSAESEQVPEGSC